MRKTIAVFCALCAFAVLAVIASPVRSMVGAHKFGMSYNNQHQTITSVSRFAWCMIFLGNTLVRDFIPVRFTNENGVTEGAMRPRQELTKPNPQGE